MKYTPRAIWEIIYPLLLTLLFIALIYFTPISNYLDIEKIAEVGITIFSIFIGFFLTVTTIINSIENEYIRALRKDENYHLLSSYLHHAIWSSLYSIILGFLYLILLKNIGGEWMAYFVIVFTFITIYALLASFRFISIFLKITMR